MYLSDLSFLEEGTPSLADDGLLNFSKLRMVSNYNLTYNIIYWQYLTHNYYLLHYRVNIIQHQLKINVYCLDCTRGTGDSSVSTDSIQNRFPSQGCQLPFGHVILDERR